MCGLTWRPSARICPQVLCCALSSGCGPLPGPRQAGAMGAPAAAGSCAGLLWLPAAVAVLLLSGSCCASAVLVSPSPPPGWDGIKRCIVLPSPPPHAQCSDCVA